ncbi:MAG: IS481 family transposase [Acidimicrobiia bacterium]|nr:IS481 family transposase [Acidimicrobiia bacterium]
MDLAGYVINAVLVEKRSVREVAAAHDVSKTWLYELLARYRELGDAGLVAKSRRPRSSPTALGPVIEEEIVALRKSLTEEGFDAGAHTIRHHLVRRHRRNQAVVPSVATIWRVLSRRGFVTPQPHKRPQSSWRRFQADLPNECWQADTTHWVLAGGRDVEILNIVDDHSRLLVAARAFAPTRAIDVVQSFHQAAGTWGFPASMLTDNGAIFTAEFRNGRCVMENELAALGVAYRHSRPYHPQTCGKVERFHQTLKKHLAKQPRPRNLAQLQAQLDRFADYYNNVRPHRALGRHTPAEAFAARTKATPSSAVIAPEGHYRVRRDRVDDSGVVTLRYRSRLHHIGLGRRYKRLRVLVLVADLDVRIITEEGELIRQLTLDPTKDYQPQDKT